MLLVSVLFGAIFLIRMAYGEDSNSTVAPTKSSLLQCQTGLHIETQDKEIIKNPITSETCKKGQGCYRHNYLIKETKLEAYHCVDLDDKEDKKNKIRLEYSGGEPSYWFTCNEDLCNGDNSSIYKSVEQITNWTKGTWQKLNERDKAQKNEPLICQTPEGPSKGSNSSSVSCEILRQTNLDHTPSGHSVLQEQKEATRTTKIIVKAEFGAGRLTFSMKATCFHNYCNAEGSVLEELSRHIGHILSKHSEIPWESITKAQEPPVTTPFSTSSSLLGFLAMILPGILHMLF